ncbi:8828_t:CDS:1, partial [Rhizophagus irregularis]
LNLTYVITNPIVKPTIYLTRRVEKNNGGSSIVLMLTTLFIIKMIKRFESPVKQHDIVISGTSSQSS